MLLLTSIPLVLALSVTLPGGPTAVPENSVHAIDGEFNICKYDLSGNRLCRPVTENDVICIPDPHSGDGKGCHVIDLRKGFNP